MWRRRYPHSEAGRLAAITFAITGAVVGAAVGLGPGAAVGPVATGALCAALSALVSFLVFSSEAPQRPQPVRQGSAADGVVSGILASFVASLVIVLISNDSAGSKALSLGGTILVLLVYTGCGAVVGGLLGLALAAAAPERLTRLPEQRRRKKMEPGRPAGARPTGAKKRKRR